MTSQAAIVGSVLGTAVGDAVGLPYEGLSRQRASRLLGTPDRYHFLFGHGMVSDDTEHTCMVMQALIASGNDADAFARQLARRLRYWLLGLPAGVGLATLRATLKLWLGVPPVRSGVFSAGNGPAMRSAVLGAAIEDRDLLRKLVQASTRITHTDPKAEYGALSVALAANMACKGIPVESGQFVDELRRWLVGQPVEELFHLLDQVVASVSARRSTEEFAAAMKLGRGVSGYVYHTRRLPSCPRCPSQSRQETEHGRPRRLARPTARQQRRSTTPQRLSTPGS